MRLQAGDQVAAASRCVGGVLERRHGRAGGSAPWAYRGLWWVVSRPACPLDASGRVVVVLGGAGASVGAHLVRHMLRAAAVRLDAVAAMAAGGADASGGGVGGVDDAGALSETRRRSS